jgi:hypothetical protein
MVKLTIWDTNLNPSNAYALTVPIHEPLGLRLAAGSDSGILGDNFTNVITPVIIGTGNPGDTVPLYEGNIVVGSGVVGSGGSWSITASPLAAGAHSLTRAETDSRGNISVPSSPALVLTIQSPPPPPPGTTLRRQHLCVRYRGIEQGRFQPGQVFRSRLAERDGEAAIWEINGAVPINGGVLPNPGPSWRVEGIGDFNADGRSDILWRNENGEVAIWEMNGISVIGGGSLPDPGLSWRLF